MIIKRTKLRQDTHCFGCSNKLKNGNKVIIVMDYMDLPYNDKCFCSERCLGVEVQFEDKLLPGVGNA